MTIDSVSSVEIFKRLRLQNVLNEITEMYPGPNHPANQAVKIIKEMDICLLISVAFPGVDTLDGDKIGQVIIENIDIPDNLKKDVIRVVTAQLGGLEATSHDSWSAAAAAVDTHEVHNPLMSNWGCTIL